MKVAVIGSRNLTVSNLEKYLPAGVTEIVSGGARGVDIHRHHDSRILPRHGLQGRDNGRLDFALGRGAARDVGPTGGDARRGGLPGVPGQPHRRVLRARGLGRVPGRRGPHRRDIGDRRGLAARRRHIRTGQPGHAAHSQGVLGPERVAGVQAPLPGDRLAAELLPVSGPDGGLVSTPTPRSRSSTACCG